MKVAINTFPTQSGHKTRGIGLYTKYLLKYLQLRGDIEIQEFNRLDEVKNVDIVHYPFFDLFSKTLPFIKKYPTVVTIHDVTPLVFPQHYPPGMKGLINFNLQRLSLKSAKRIITDSTVSKNDIHRYLAVPKEKVSVVFLAAGEHFKPIKDRKKLQETRAKYSLPEKFSLYVGNINWNKNIINLTEASLKAGLPIALVGGGFQTRDSLDHPELRSFVSFLSRFGDNPRVKILGFVPDKDLAAIYNLASVCLFPSFYEGFGLPILEAQSCGCPVVTSNIASMPEIAGAGALLVNPYQAAEIEKAIRRIMGSSQEKEKIVQEGFKNVARFSWEKTAGETLGVYQQVLKF